MPHQHVDISRTKRAAPRLPFPAFCPFVMKASNRWNEDEKPNLSSSAHWSETILFGTAVEQQTGAVRHKHSSLTSLLFRGLSNSELSNIRSCMTSCIISHYANCGLCNIQGLAQELGQSGFVPLHVGLNLHQSWSGKVAGWHLKVSRYRHLNSSIYSFSNTHRFALRGLEALLYTIHCPKIFKNDHKTVWNV